mgnify:CR=1 FL=1
MDRRSFTLALAVTLAAPATAWAGVAPLPCDVGSTGFGALRVGTPQPLAVVPNLVATVCVNGRRIDFVDFLVNDKRGGGVTYTLPMQTVDLGNGASFEIGATLNPDPFVIFSFGSVLPSGFGPLTFGDFRD